MQRLRAEFRRRSERHLCELLQIPRSSCRYRKRKNDDDLRGRLVALAYERPRFGYRRLQVLLERDGMHINHKRVQRVYREVGLGIKRVRRKRLTRSQAKPEILTKPNQEWALDFVSDALANGRRLRVLCVVDAFTRECLALEADTSFPSRRVTGVLRQIMQQRGKPQALRSDNGPEISSPHYLGWCLEQQITAVHIQPGKPMQNGHVESFNGRFREECLNASWFWNLWDARRKISAWRVHYNQQRPHSSLGYRTPAEFARVWENAASPSRKTDTVPPESSQDQALRAPKAALTAPQLHGRELKGEGDAAPYAGRVV